ncbi:MULTISPECIES: 50S ribosomal protein L37 [Actinomadura]
MVNRDMSKKTRKRRARKRSKHNKGKRPNARR